MCLSMHLTAESPSHARFASALALLLDGALRSNLLLSNSACIRAAEGVVATLRSEAARWTESEYAEYRSSAYVIEHVSALRAAPFCVGPAFTSSSVEALFAEAEGDLLRHLRARLYYAQMSVAVVYALAAWSATVLCFVLTRVARSHTTLSAAGRWAWPKDGLGTAARVASVLAVPAALVAGGVIVFVPDLQLHAAFIGGVAAVLVAYALVAIRITMAVRQDTRARHYKELV
jgi:hypothetical protein